MIPPKALDQWSETVAWTSRHQIEQDLVLTRLATEVASHPVLCDKLSLKGGTSLHKLWLSVPWRYSEDLDYNRIVASDPLEIIHSLREIASDIGFSDTTFKQNKLFLHLWLTDTLVDGQEFQVKIDIQREIKPDSSAYQYRQLVIDSPWYSNQASVRSNTAEDIVASKVLALFQRARPRDLFDMWAAIKAGIVTYADVASRFAPYRPDNPERWNTSKAARNLVTKLSNPSYMAELERISVYAPFPYDEYEPVQIAADLIDACAQATQSSSRWQRVVKNGTTAKILLNDWIQKQQESKQRSSRKR